MSLETPMRLTISLYLLDTIFVRISWIGLLLQGGSLVVFLGALVHGIIRCLCIYVVNNFSRQWIPLNKGFSFGCKSFKFLYIFLWLITSKLRKAFLPPELWEGPFLLSRHFVKCELNFFIFITIWSFLFLWCEIKIYIL